jgi:hypothetical protein
LKYMVRLRNHGGQGTSFAVEQKGPKALLAWRIRIHGR